MGRKRNPISTDNPCQEHIALMLRELLDAAGRAFGQFAPRAGGISRVTLQRAASGAHTLRERTLTAFAEVCASPGRRPSSACEVRPASTSAASCTSSARPRSPRRSAAGGPQPHRRAPLLPPRPRRLGPSHDAAGLGCRPRRPGSPGNRRARRNTCSSGRLPRLAIQRTASRVLRGTGRPATLLTPTDSHIIQTNEVTDLDVFRLHSAVDDRSSVEARDECSWPGSPGSARSFGDRYGHCPGVLDGRRCVPRGGRHFYVIRVCRSLAHDTYGDVRRLLVPDRREADVPVVGRVPLLPAAQPGSLARHPAEDEGGGLQRRVAVLRLGLPLPCARRVRLHWCTRCGQAVGHGQRPGHLCDRPAGSVHQRRGRRRRLPRLAVLASGQHPHLRPGVHEVQRRVADADRPHHQAPPADQRHRLGDRVPGGERVLPRHCGRPCVHGPAGKAGEGRRHHRAAGRQQQRHLQLR